MTEISGFPWWILIIGGVAVVLVVAAKNHKRNRQVKYRMSGGLAMTPNRDMNMLKIMSVKGWHVTGMSGIRYRFEHGEPHDYDYAMNCEHAVDAEMLSLYETSGWTPVMVLNGVGGYQIFRAEAGTPHIFSDVDSEIEVLRRSRRFYGKWSLIFFGALVGVIISALLAFKLLELSKIAFIGLCILFVLIWLCFISFFTPFVGQSVTIAKKKRRATNVL
jgi:hypothetical protein